MKYDPFSRGPYPVGVRSAELRDAARGERTVEVELWYPATAAYSGMDRSAETQDLYAIFGAHQVKQEAVRDAEGERGPFPLAVFSHGMAGHRRQSTFFCTHLASHGYVVVSPDHGGGTVTDLIQVAMRLRLGGEVPSDVASLVAGHVADRPRDLAFLLDALTSGALSAPSGLDLSRIAVTGHSFGGFTALVLAQHDPRVGAVVALAPAGGAGPLATTALTSALTLALQPGVSTLYLGLGRDTLLPLEGVIDLYRRTPAPARMFVLPQADHMHFCDRAESSHEFFRALPPVGLFGELLRRLPPFSELTAAAHGYAFANALGLAQLDATLAGSVEARAFLEHHAVDAFAARGVEIVTVR